MKKIAILGVADLRHMTMMSIYTDYFNKNSIEYEIICSERYKDSQIEYEGKRVYKFPMVGNETKKITKLLFFLRFRQFAIDILKEQQYDFIIVWGENTAVLFEDYLKKHGRYCVNIRDSVFSKMPFYFSRLTKAVQNSSFSTWCAQTGQELLPRHNYIIVLNQNRKLLRNAQKTKKLRQGNEVIRIGAIGAIRYIEENKKVMFELANDERYMIQFFGNGSDELRVCAEENNIKNVEFCGHFLPEQTATLLNKIDVMNVYCGDGKDDVNITLGAPIRFGYATYLYKPAIVSPNTRLSRVTKELNIGYTVEKMDGFADEFYEWYHKISYETFVKGCDVYNKEYEQGFNNLYEQCDRFIRNK